MKSIIIALLSIFLLGSCSTEDLFEESPHLPYAPVNILINLDDPMYSFLKGYQQAAFIDDGFSGVLGVIVYNSGSGFRAYEAACPNHRIKDCSTLQFDGNLLYCECENADFSMQSGNALQGRYHLREYSVTSYRNTLSIIN